MADPGMCRTPAFLEATVAALSADTPTPELETAQHEIAREIATAVSRKILSGGEAASPTLITVEDESGAGALQSLPTDTAFPSFPSTDEVNDE